MKVFYDSPVVPKRGDILQTNVGDRRERTFLILRVRPSCRIGRYNLWAERWWQLEPEQRIALFRSAERAGGQQVHPFYRYPAKKKPKVINGWFV